MNPLQSKGVIVAVDVDNLLISSAAAGQIFQGYSLEAGFHKLFAWVGSFGTILAVHLYLPVTQSINDALWHKLWERYHKEIPFETIYCPRKQPDLKKVDNVDCHLIEYSKHLVALFADRVKYFCLVSGDLDYSQFLWQLKRDKGIEIAFALGSEESFSKIYRVMQFAGKHPKTGEDLIYYFSPHV